ACYLLEEDLLRHQKALPEDGYLSTFSSLFVLILLLYIYLFIYLFIDRLIDLFSYLFTYLHIYFIYLFLYLCIFLMEIYFPSIRAPVADGSPDIVIVASRHVGTFKSNRLSAQGLPTMEADGVEKPITNLDVLLAQARAVLMEEEWARFGNH